jgi:hypothetical protein
VVSCFKTAFLLWCWLGSLSALGIPALRTLYGGSKKVVEPCHVAAFSLLEMAESTSLVDVFGGIAESGRLDHDLV